MTPYWLVPPSTIARYMDRRLKKYDSHTLELREAMWQSFDHRIFRVHRDTAELASGDRDSYVLGFAVYLGIPFVRVEYV